MRLLEQPRRGRDPYQLLPCDDPPAEVPNPNSNETNTTES